jgi:hypothetical protein
LTGQASKKARGEELAMDAQRDSGIFNGRNIAGFNPSLSFGLFREEYPDLGIRCIA